MNPDGSDRKTIVTDSHLPEVALSGVSLKSPQPADPVDHVTGQMGVPHDAIERFSRLVQVRWSMIQKSPSDLSVGDYRRNALCRFSHIV
jgi:hypothetical protein